MSAYNNIALLLTVLFIMILPFFFDIFEIIRGAFVFFMYKDIVFSEKYSSKKFLTIMRILSEKEYWFSRKLIKDSANVKKFLLKASHADYQQVHSYHTINGEHCEGYAVAFKNLISNNIMKSEEVEDLAIATAEKFHNPAFIYYFAIATENMKNIKKNKLYSAVAKYKGSGYKFNFENKFRKYPEVDRLISLS